MNAKTPFIKDGVTLIKKSEGNNFEIYNTTDPKAYKLLVALDDKEVGGEDIKISCKGQVLNTLQVFWLEGVLKDFPNYIVYCGDSIFRSLPLYRDFYPFDLSKRAMVVRNLRFVKIRFSLISDDNFVYNIEYVDKKNKSKHVGLVVVSGAEVKVKSCLADCLRSGQKKLVNLAINAFTSMDKHLRKNQLTIKRLSLRIGISSRKDLYLMGEDFNDTQLSLIVGGKIFAPKDFQTEAEYLDFFQKITKHTLGGYQKVYMDY